MWKNLKDSEYFLMFKQNYGIEIYITDYLSIWSTMYSDKAFLSQLKQSNDGLELQNDDDFILKGLQLLSKPELLKKLSIEKEENGKSLFITMSISFGFPFYLECKLSKGSEELYFQKITQPLLKTVGDLRASECELRRLLIKKDKEIEEYKSEGGEIVLRHLKTAAFNDEEHMKKYKVYEETFGTNNLPARLIEKTFDKPEQMKPETNGIKQETNAHSHNVKPQEVKSEPEFNTITEPINNSIKTETDINVKIEPDINVKTEAGIHIKSETRPALRAGIPMKRSKFKF